MAQQDAVIRLLLVEDQLEDAEHLISMLRNGGMAIRPQRPESPEDLDNLLASQSIDLVLARNDARYISLRPGRARWSRRPARTSRVLATADALDEATVLAVHRRRRPRRGPAPRARARAVRGSQRVPVPAQPARPAPPGSGAARDRAPLRRADLVLARPDRLRARGHAHPRQPGLPGNVRLRGLRGDRGPVGARPDLARRTPTPSSNCSSASTRARRRRGSCRSGRSAPTAAPSTRAWSSPRPPTKASPACRSCSASRPWTRTWPRNWTRCASATRSPSCSTASTS